MSSIVLGVFACCIGQTLCPGFCLLIMSGGPDRSPCWSDHHHAISCSLHWMRRLRTLRSAAGLQPQGTRKVLARGTALTDHGPLGIAMEAMDCCCSLIPALVRLEASSELVGLQSYIRLTFVPAAARRAFQYF